MPCPACAGSLVATHGPVLPGPRVAVELLGRGLAGLAAGVGRRGPARGCEVEPKTGLQWVGEAAEQLHACARPGLPGVRLRPGQRAARLARRSAVKEGAVSEAEASERLARSPRGVWVALDPESTRRLALDVGHRPRALAQGPGHPVLPGLAPGWVPLFLPDGFQESPRARPAQGPAPTPRWRPLPPRRDAPGVKTGRRRRRVAGTPRVGLGTLAAVAQV